MRWMHLTACRWVAMCVAGLAASTSVARAQREPHIVETSAQAVFDMIRDPNRGVPREVLRDAQGVIIFPNMLQAGFLIGARYGRGIVVVRDGTGQWSNPFFIRMTGGSVGLLAGADTNEMMLVFRERRTIDRFLLGLDKMTFGVDASLAAGPMGGGVGAKTDPALRADILVYSRSRGLYAGAAIEGAVAQVDHRANWVYYGLDATPAEIVNSVEGLMIPAQVERLKRVLDLPNRRTRRVPPPEQPQIPRDDSPIIEPIPGLEPDRSA